MFSEKGVVNAVIISGYNDNMKIKQIFKQLVRTFDVTIP